MRDATTAVRAAPAQQPTTVSAAAVSCCWNASRALPVAPRATTLSRVSVSSVCTLAGQQLMKIIFILVKQTCYLTLVFLINTQEVVWISIIRKNYWYYE